ncbi:MAG: hypothetical protein ACK5LC_15575, partial [Coprobacillaceae bacterium]
EYTRKYFARSYRIIEFEELTLKQFFDLAPNTNDLAKLRIEKEQGFSTDELLLLSIELNLKAWINAHAKQKKKPRSILEEINRQDKASDLIEKYKRENIKDRYEK